MKEPRHPTEEKMGKGFAFFRQQCLDPDWVILVARGGAYLFAGTEERAEIRRCNDAVDGQTVAKKRPASYADVIGVQSPCWNHRSFLNRYRYADCGCGDCNV